MILSFKNKETEALFLGRGARRFPADVKARMVRKLQVLHASTRIEDLRIPAGNRLEALSGDRRGYYSIRVNDQWRICFRWDGVDAQEVEIVDYH